jgi:DNA-binding NarL/FixJ family response regulator
MKIKVFITDDHYMVVEGIHTLLQHEDNIAWMGHASDANSCLAYLQQQLPDVILMDISMPGISGIELCREVKEKYPGVFVIGLSTFNQQSFIQKMMENGASGYVLKNATREELIEAIHTVAKGKQFLSFDAATALRKPETETNVPVITRREKEVLELIADGLTNNEIAQKLFISSTTVDTHRKNLLAKFEAKNTASLIRMAAHSKII